MVNALTPQAYVYLRHPILSTGETMLYHTLQHLCFTGAVAVSFTDVRVRGERKRIVHLERARGNAPTSKSEAFALQFLPRSKRRSVEDLWAQFEREIADHERFKYELIGPELRDAGLLSGNHSRTGLGVARLRRTRDLLFTVQQDIGRRLDGGWQRSFRHVQALGSAVVLLNKRTRVELITASARPRDLVAVFTLLSQLEAASAASGTDGDGDRWSTTPFSMGGTGGGYSGGSGDGGGFGGFGGGDFGGAGAGGSW